MNYIVNYIALNIPIFARTRKRDLSPLFTRCPYCYSLECCRGEDLCIQPRFTQVRHSRIWVTRRYMYCGSSRRVNRNLITIRNHFSSFPCRVTGKSLKRRIKAGYTYVRTRNAVLEESVQNMRLHARVKVSQRGMIPGCCRRRHHHSCFRLALVGVGFFVCDWDGCLAACLPACLVSPACMCRCRRDTRDSCLFIRIIACSRNARIVGGRFERALQLTLGILNSKRDKLEEVKKMGYNKNN